MSTDSQLALFDTRAAENATQAAAARTRMRDMIERLRAATAPPWRDQSAVILDDGAFQRAMRLVPTAEAQALWVEFDAETERLYAVWAAAQTAPGVTGC